VSEERSYRQILRATTITGTASVINVLVGLIRMKFAAVLLGPAGIGVLSLLQNAVSAATVIASLGTSNSGTRQIAEAAAQDDWPRVANSRTALFLGTLALAGIGALAFWNLREVLSDWAFGSADYARQFGWLAAAVALAVASGAQAALLNGLRRIGDLARVSVFSAMASTVLGVAALWILGGKGIVVFILSAPLANFLLGHWYVSKLPGSGTGGLRMREVSKEWLSFARLGAVFMLAGVAGSLAQLLVRVFVQRELSSAALGHFQASWTLSMTYIGFVLQAMGADYYPRLAGIVRDHKEANRVVNEQTEVAILLAGPILLAMSAFAPWILRLLYSSAFEDAAIVLRWQVLGDALKVASWPLGYLLLAAGAGRAYLFSETLAMTMLAAVASALLPVVGLRATGMAFLAMYAVYLPIVFLLARRLTSFSWRGRVLIEISILFLSTAVVGLMASWSQMAGAIFGGIATAAFAYYALRRLTELASITPNLEAIRHRMGRFLGRLR
jgi:PST family polysaccharide transporter